MADHDPGWPVSWRTVLWLLVPQLGLRRAAQGVDGVHGLVVLRQVFLSFCVALVLFGVVLAVISNGEEPVQDFSTGVVAGLLVLAAVGVLVEARFEKPLRCEDDRSLADSYRTRFFLRVAFAEAAALFGFVGFFLTYAWWPYPVGVLIAAIGFTRAAPTRRNLARDQDQLALQQCGRSLIEALRHLPAR